MLRDAMAVRIPDRIILGVDFQDYLTVPRALSEAVPKASPRLRDAERRLLVDNDGRPNPQRKWQVWKDGIAATLTIDALTDSVDDPVEQNPQRRNDDGSRVQSAARVSYSCCAAGITDVFGRKTPPTVSCMPLCEAGFRPSLLASDSDETNAS